MFEYLYEWLRDISYYLILVTAVTYVLPSNSYRKYIRFFTGLVLILMMAAPVLNMLGNEELTPRNLIEEYSAEYKLELPELEEEIDFEENEESGIRIEVEDIVVGP